MTTRSAWVWLLLLPTALYAQDEDAPAPPALEGRGDWAVSGLSGEDRASRLLEYQDIPESLQIRDFRFWTPPSADPTYFNARVIDASQRDQMFSVRWGRQGSHELSVDWVRIPHRYGFDGSTLYTGIGSGALRISDSIQSDIETNSVSFVDAESRLLGFVTGGSHELDDPDDVLLQRDRASIGLKLHTEGAWTFETGLDHEVRSGVRPMWGAFGFRNATQLLAPVDDRTWTIRAAAHRTAETSDLSFEYSYNTFRNREEALVWDNPYRDTDGTSPVAYLMSYESGAREGRLALAGDSQVHRLAFRGGWSLGETTRVGAGASLAWIKSETDLQPWTTNTAIDALSVPPAPFDASDPSNLPDGSFSGEGLRQSYNVSLSARPWDRFTLQSYLNLNRWDDKREMYSQVGYVRSDAVWEAIPQSNERLDYTHWVAGARGSWRLPSWQSTLKPEVRFDYWDREHRQSERVTDLSGKLSLKTRWSRRVSTDIGVGAAVQNADSGYDLPADELLYMRIYDQVDRDRSEAHLGIDWSPSDSFSTGLMIRYSNDDYDLNFGLREAMLRSALLNLNWIAGEDFTLAFFGGADLLETEQKSRQWTPGDIGDPSDPLFAPEEDFSNWTADTRRKAFMIGLEPRLALSEKTRLTARYTFAWNRTSIDFASLIGTAGVDDNNAFEPGDLVGADNWKRHSLDMRLTTTVGEGVRFYVGYGYQVFTSENFYNEGLSSVAPTSFASGGYLLNLTFEDARVHLGYIGLLTDF